jgi:hypothetical protein
LPPACDDPTSKGVYAVTSPVRSPLWFVRSLADRDTHKGTYSTVTRSVHAVCGIEFVPRPLPVSSSPALPAGPQDPDQICQQCRSKAGATR